MGAAENVGEYRMMEQPPFEKTPISQGVEQNAGLAFNEVPADAEQQARYEDYVVNGMQLMHSKNTRKQIVELMKAEGGANGVARALSMVINNLNQQAESSGFELEEELQMQAGRELCEQLLEVAQAAGVVDEITPELAEEVVVKTIDLIMGREAEMEGELDMSWVGDVDPEGAEQLASAGYDMSDPEAEQLPPDQGMAPEMM